MKKTDIEALSLALLAAACGPTAGRDDGKAVSSQTPATPPAATAQAEGEREAGAAPAGNRAEPVPTKKVRSSLPTRALARTGRLGG